MSEKTQQQNEETAEPMAEETVTAEAKAEDKNAGKKKDRKEDKKLKEENEALAKTLEELGDRYTRMLAEYDNFRKRTQKEREALYTDIKAETVGKFLPVFDNLQRALAQPTADEAYKKGVEMTMTGLM